MNGTVRPGAVVLVDTNVIIEAHRISAWAYGVETVEDCVTETQTGRDPRVVRGRRCLKVDGERAEPVREVGTIIFNYSVYQGTDCPCAGVELAGGGDQRNGKHGFVTSAGGSTFRDEMMSGLTSWWGRCLT